MFILTQFRRHFSGTTFRDLQLLFVATRDVRGGAFSSEAGQGGKFAGQGGVGRGDVGSLMTYGRIFKPGHNSMVEHKKHVFLCQIARGLQMKLK